MNLPTSNFGLKNNTVVTIFKQWNTLMTFTLKNIPSEIPGFFELYRRIYYDQSFSYINLFGNCLIYCFLTQSSKVMLLHLPIRFKFIKLWIFAENISSAFWLEFCSLFTFWIEIWLLKTNNFCCFEIIKRNVKYWMKCAHDHSFVTWCFTAP